jgi:hypothetical protein
MGLMKLIIKGGGPSTTVNIYNTPVEEKAVGNVSVRSPFVAGPSGLPIGVLVDEPKSERDFRFVKLGGTAVTRPSDGLTDTPASIGTDPPPPATDGSEGPRKAPAVFADVPATMRRWDHDGLHTFLVSHGQMVTLSIPREVLMVLVKGFRDAMDAAYGPEQVAEDTLAETVAEEYLVRPGAVYQAKAVALHVINTVTG